MTRQGYHHQNTIRNVSHLPGTIQGGDGRLMKQRLDETYKRLDERYKAKNTVKFTPREGSN